MDCDPRPVEHIHLSVSRTNIIHGGLDQDISVSIYPQPNQTGTGTVVSITQFTGMEPHRIRRCLAVSITNTYVSAYKISYQNFTTLTTVTVEVRSLRKRVCGSHALHFDLATLAVQTDGTFSMFENCEDHPFNDKATVTQYHPDHMTRISELLAVGHTRRNIAATLKNGDAKVIDITITNESIIIERDRW